MCGFIHRVALADGASLAAQLGQRRERWLCFRGLTVTRAVYPKPLTCPLSPDPEAELGNSAFGS